MTRKIYRGGGKLYCITRNRIQRNLYLPSVPDWYSIAVTFRCNSRCATCGIWNAEPEPEINLDVYERFFKDPVVREARHIEFTGGEPTLRKDIVEVMSFAYENCPKAEFSLGTNCLLPSRVCEIVDAFRNQGLHVSVSVDGYGELHDEIRGVSGNFDKVVSVIDHIQALRKGNHPVSVGASICVSTLNVRRLSALIEFLNERNVKFQLDPYLKIRYARFDRSRVPYLTLDFNTPDDRNAVCELFSRYDRPTYERFIKFWQNQDYEKPPCYVLTKGSVSVRPNGDVPVCNYLDRDFILGNVAKQSFSEMWKSRHVQELRKKLHNCRECAFAHPNLCDALNNYYFHGSAFRDQVLAHLQSKAAKGLVKLLLM